MKVKLRDQISDNVSEIDKKKGHEFAGACNGTRLRRGRFLNTSGLILFLEADETSSEDSAEPGDMGVCIRIDHDYV